MPDFGLFCEAWFLSAAVAAAWVAVTALLFRRSGPATERAAAVASVVAGAVTGFFRLGDTPRIPYPETVDRLAAAVLPAASAAEVSAFLARMPTPVAVDRLLWIVLPAAVVVEAAGAVATRFSGRFAPARWFIWLLRALVAAGIAPVLLRGSGYVSGTWRQWSTGEAVGVYAGIGAAVFGVWLLTAIGNRRATWAAAAATTVSLQATGIVMFLATYLGGGKAALPLTGALCGALAASAMPSCRGRNAEGDPSARTAHGETLLSLAVVGLAGLLVVGRFFSRVESWEAVVLGAAPLLTLVGALPVVAKQRPWIAATVTLGSAAIGPAIVVYLAKRAFDEGLELLM
jgi:hypothetical protein